MCFSNIYTLSTVIMASKVNEGASDNEGVKKEHLTLTLMKNRGFKNAANNLVYGKSVYSVVLFS
jgi:hypothetical protein